MRDIEELRELREYDAGAPPLDDATRRRMRVRLYAAMDAESAGNAEKAGHGPAPAVRHRRRAVLRIALTGAVAAAVVGGVLVAAGEGDDSGGARPAAGSPGLQNVSAQTVLAGAAAYARQHEKTAGPRDDQFVYTKEITRDTNLKTGASKSSTDENWRSVDDSKPSWVMEAGKGWWAPPAAAGETVWPPQDWKTLKKLPTDPRKLILSLVPGSVSGGKGGALGGITEQQWSAVHFRLAGLLQVVPVMPGGLRPAAYAALGMIPGVKTVPNQKDAKGLTGVAITYEDPTLPPGVTAFGSYLVFDPKTYAFLGWRQEFVSHDGKHTVERIRFSYLDSWAIVDKARQRP